MSPLATRLVLGLAVFVAVFASATYVVRKYNAGQQAIAQVAAANERAAAAERATALLGEALAQRDQAHSDIRAHRASTNKRISDAIQEDPEATGWASERLPDWLRDLHLNH